MEFLEDNDWRIGYSLLAMMLLQLLASCALVADAESPAVSEPDFSLGANEYGAQGSLTPEEWDKFYYLGWPQQRSDMIGSFGFPRHLEEGAEYYELEGKNTWVIVEYDGLTATGYRLKEMD